ncbi:MAG: DUF2147 domain-containing protein [Acidobacteriota bacterium]
MPQACQPKTLLLLALALLAALAAPATAAAHASDLAEPDLAEPEPAEPEPAIDRLAIEGVWVNAAGDGLIEIRRQGESLIGVILGGTDGGDRLDALNPDPALRSRRLTGLTILEGFGRVSNERWTGGTIYDPNNGKTYRCNLELEDESTLKVRGYLGVSLFGRTERWTRRAESR